MKSCIEWRKSFKYLPEIDQFNINYKNKEIKLVSFLEEYAKSQRVNIRLPEDYTDDDMKLLEAIYERDKPNIALILPDKFYVNELREKGIPFFFASLATTWDELTYLLPFKPVAVYISGELGFDLERVNNVLLPLGIEIRCFVNVTQSSGQKMDDGFKNFFIRPEDMDIYSMYVDVFEFYDSVDKQNVLYEVYFKDKKWDGKLRDLIKGLSNDVNNYYIMGDEFGKRRTHCRKRCIKGERCMLCERLTEFANTLEKSPDYEVFRRRQ